MPDSPCATSATPTPGWISRLIRLDFPEDPKRLQLLLSVTCLVLGFLALAVPCAVRIWRTGDLGGGAVAALLGASGPLAGLAGWAHGKPDGPTPPGGDQ